MCWIASAITACSTPATTNDATPDRALDATTDIGADLGAELARDAAVLPPLPTVEGLAPLTDENPDPRVVEVHLTAAAGETSFLSSATTRVLAYNGQVPGPLLHARVGDRVIVHFRNDLTEPTTVHWHGLRIPDAQDGSPRIQTPVMPGETFTYEFTPPDPGTFWYHAHVSTIEQIDRGLYGAIVVHEAEPPPFDHERIVVLDDVRLDRAGVISPFLNSGPDVGRGRLGNQLLINGHVEPLRVDVARHGVERWRIVNAANARTFVLNFESGARLRVIGTDGGLFANPYETPELTVAPGQRYDLEMRFDDDAHEAWTLRAMVLVGLTDGGVETRPFSLVTAQMGEAVAPRPAYVPPERMLPDPDPASYEERTWNLSGGIDGGVVEFTINGVAGHHSDTAHDHPLERFEQGRPVRITLQSMVSPEHPFHLHGQFFQIVSPARRAAAEPGLKDIVLVQGNQPVTILTYLENPGRWMYHCHIAEHTERGMMSEFEVVPRQQ